MATIISRSFSIGFATTILLFWGIFSCSLVAQTTKKIQKDLEKANEDFQREFYSDARIKFQEILISAPNNLEAIVKLAESNFYLENYNEALGNYSQALQIDSVSNDTLYFWTGITHKNLGNCAQAIYWLNKFKNKHVSQDYYFQRAQRDIEGCENQGKRNNIPYELRNVSFNSEAADIFPAYREGLEQTKEIVFTSHRVENGKGKFYSRLGQPNFSDLYAIEWLNDSTFGAVPQNLGNLVNGNGKQNTGSATFADNGLTMYFTMCNTKQNKEGCSIYTSRYNTSRKSWGKPELVEELAGKKPLRTKKGKIKIVPTDDANPSVTPDGNTMYFSSDRPDGKGGYDIWYSQRVGTRWASPISLDTTINSRFDESSPFISSDGTKIYFSSNGWGGAGGFDVYSSEKRDGTWLPNLNVGPPINSNADEIGAIWMRNDSLVYFSSNRQGGRGSYDIYWGKLTGVIGGTLALQGLVRDRDTQLPIPFSTAILFEKDTEGFLIPLDTFSTGPNADYYFDLEFDKEYKVLGNAPEYLANEIEVSTEGVTAGILERNIDIALEPIYTSLPIVLQNIYYDFDEFYLRDDAKRELDQIVFLLQQNNNITIQMGSHTDSNGSLQYNDRLSDNRARSAVKYLIDRGINPSRLTWFGYGENEPLIYPEESDEDEQANRRTEFRILSIDFQ